MFTLIKKEGRARRGHFHTVHGDFETPAFMNVATAGAIKGALSSVDLETVRCQVMLANTYHLHVRTGEEKIHQLGGIRNLAKWNGPVLTDSGGFQVFSLAKLRNIKEEGVTFNSHVDGRKIFIGPEESMRIQSRLGSTIAMAFDECVQNPATYDYASRSVERTYRWLVRCQEAMKDNNAAPDALNPDQLLFGINQGATFEDLRIEHMKEIAKLNCDGYAIGGLAVGEPTEEMYHIIDIVEPYAPADKIRYLMGVGTPGNIIRSVNLGVDLFDCVMPARNGRHGHLFTWDGIININNQKYELDERPIDPNCDCPICSHGFTRAYIHHLVKAKEMLALRFCVMHNLYFYNHLMEEIRKALDEGRYAEFVNEYADRIDQRI